jgi:ribosomal protein S18 acetylase RimI-like enzyme
MDIQIKFASKEEKQLILRFEDYLKEKRLTQILENNEIILAFDNERNIGYLRYQLFWTKLPYLALIIVDKRYRKKGVGRSLLSFLENHLRLLGFNRLLSSSTSNEPNPQAWHKKVGFREVGQVNEINMNGIGEVFYLKNI